MELKIICPIWGMEGNLGDNLKKIKEAGFDGVEMRVPDDKIEKFILKHTLKDYDLVFVGQQWSAQGRTFQEYSDNYAAELYNLSELEPLLINSHTGKDYFTYEQNCHLLEKAEQISLSTGIRLAHETIRGSFAAHPALLNQYINFGIKLTADFSEWCAATNSYLEPHADFVNAAIENTIHIHARVGQPSSPQVSDPRAPEWKQALNNHLGWWDKIIAHHRLLGTEILTITPEFGPAPYMQALPYTGQAVASQWEINCYMKDMLKEKYAAFAARKTPFLKINEEEKAALVAMIRHQSN